MRAIAKEFAAYFDTTGLTAVLTVEASGIALGAICAEELGVPLVFAKKAKSDNIEGGLYQSEIFSYTYKKKVTLILASQWLNPEDKVLIVDDFLANGKAIGGLMSIIRKAEAQLIGVGIAIEKGFQPGGKLLREQGIPLLSLAVIDEISDAGIRFRDADGEI